MNTTFVMRCGVEDGRCAAARFSVAQQRPAIDPAGEPGQQRRADADHQTARNLQETRAHDADAEVRRHHIEQASRQQDARPDHQIAQHEGPEQQG